MSTKTLELAGTTVTLNAGAGGLTLDADSGTITFANAGSSLGTITSDGWTGDVVGDVTGRADTATTVTNGIYTTSKLNALASTSSSELAGVISDETGSGLLVFGSSPTLTSPTINAAALSGTFSGTPTFSGATTFSNTVTVGVDDTGYDVKLFGATAGAYMLWDESADDLLLAGGAGLVQSGDGQITFTGNVDASSGLDVTGAALTTNQSITQTGTNANTFTGATTFSNTVTVGIDDTGYDVKLFGATAGAYMLWDESANDLTLVGGAGLVQSGAGANTLTGATTFNAGISVKNGSTSAGFIKFYENSANGSNKVTLIGPASTADITLTLPSSVGTADQVLSTNGYGVLSWVDAGSGGGGSVSGNTFDADLKIGRDSDNNIDFTTDNKIVLETEGNIDLYTKGSGDNYIKLKYLTSGLTPTITEYAHFKRDSTNNDLIVKTLISNSDIIFKGIDGGSTITALTLDMSEGGLMYSSKIDKDNSLIGQGTSGGFSNVDKCDVFVNKFGGEIITTIQVDMGSGNIGDGSSGGFLETIIGNRNGGDANFYKILSATNGFVYKIELCVIEEFEVNSSGSPSNPAIGIAYSSGLSSEALANQSVDNSNNFLLMFPTSSYHEIRSIDGVDEPLSNNYLYFCSNGTNISGNNNVTAGKFLVKLYGATF